MTKIKIPTSRGHRVTCALCGTAVQEYELIMTPDGGNLCIAAKCHGHFDLAIYASSTLDMWAGTHDPGDELHAPPTMMFLRASVSTSAFAVETRKAVQRYAEAMGGMWFQHHGLPDVWRGDRNRPAQDAKVATPRRRRMENVTATAPGALGRPKRRMDDV